MTEAGRIQGALEIPREWSLGNGNKVGGSNRRKMLGDYQKSATESHRVTGLLRYRHRYSQQLLSYQWAYCVQGRDKAAGQKGRASPKLGVW